MRCGSKGVSNGIFKEPLLVQKPMSCYLLQHTGCRLTSDSGTFLFPLYSTFIQNLLSCNAGPSCKTGVR